MSAGEVVLCYHAVSRDWDHRLSIHPELLVRQVKLLTRFWRVRASFDDAFRSAASVFPELARMRVPVQIFVCSGHAHEGAALTIPELAGDDAEELATMTWAELRAHSERGVQIGSHGVSHAHLPSLGDDELRREVTESKREIEDRLGRRCTDFAYPYGEHDARVRAAVRDARYAAGYALRGRTRDTYAMPRIDLYRRHTPMRAALRTLSARIPGRSGSS
jgi:peptidoglycan/xylan/chitin deacetylase (PgdA/CDA1 family)